MLQIRHAFRLTPMVIALLMAQGANASGYNIGTQSVAAQGTANANGAEALDASVLYANPAGIAGLEGTSFSVVANYVLPDVSFTVEGQPTANLGGQLVPIAGGDGGEPADGTVIPHFYMSHRLSEDKAFGLAVFVPFGADVEWDDNFAGRYYQLKTRLATINVNPTFAMALDDQTHIGIGLNAQYIEGELARMVYGPSIAGGLAQRLAVAGNLTAAQAAAIAQGAAAANTLNNQDALFEVEGDSWAFGFNAGILHHFSEDTRMGLAYRSRIKQDVEGSASLSRLENVKTYLTTQGINPAISNSIATTADANLQLDTPESASINLYHRLNKAWAVMADVTWTGHDRLDQIVVEAQPITTTYLETDWRTTAKLSLGATWQTSDAFQLRFGYMYDESPVPSAEKTLTTLPDNDRQWFSIGARMKFGEANSLDLAYSHILIEDRGLNRSYDSSTFDNTPDNDRPPVGLNNVPGSSAGVVQGTFESSASIVGLQWNASF